MYIPSPAITILKQLSDGREIKKIAFAITADLLEFRVILI